MSGFTPTFGGSPVQPAQVSYKAYLNYSSSFALLWPTGLQDTVAPAAFFVDLTPTAAGLTVSLPDATQVSPGTALILYALGAYTVLVGDYAGGSVTNIIPGAAKYVILTDNSTAAGVWRVVQFGAGTSAADASALAGPGLQALSGMLAWAPTGVTLNASGNVSTGNRAQFIVWTGGVGTLTLPTVASATSGFLVMFSNSGSGALTVAAQGGEFIDNAASVVLNPTESMLVEVVNGKWYSVGRGRTLSTNPVSTFSKNLGGLLTYTLSASEAAAQIQTFTDAPPIAGAFTLFYGSTSSFYFVDNQVTGNTVSFRGAPADPGVNIPSGTKAIIVNRAGTMSLAVSVTTGTVTSVATTARLTGGPITTTGTLDLAVSGVGAGTYGSLTALPALTVDVYGRITVASNLAISPTRLIGESVRWNGVDLPAGYLWEDGSAVSRATYALLFAAITSTATATPTNLSATLTGVSKDYRNLGVEGAKVEGTNIPAGTTVVSVTVNTIVMSAVANGSPGPVTVRLLPHGSGDGVTTFNVPDRKGRVGMARDNMGGTPVNRVTAAVSGVPATVLGGSGGDQNMQGHSHFYAFDTAGPIGAFGSVLLGTTSFGAFSSSTTGTGVAQNMPPVYVANSIIFAGV